MRIPTATLLTLALLASLRPASAEEAKTCQEILDGSAEHLTLGLGGGRVRIRFEIKTTRGDVRQRTLEVKSQKVDERAHALVKFLSPADVAGTAFLMIENKDGPDDQVMFLPALKRTRRITGASRKGSFMGSDFAFADLETKESDESECTRQADDKLEGQPVWVIQTTPKTLADDDLYSKAVMWIHQKTWVPLKVELYDRDGKKLKRMTVQELKKKGGTWIAMKTTMENLQKGSSTKITLEEVELDASFPPETFTERALER